MLEKLALIKNLNNRAGIAALVVSLSIPLAIYLCPHLLGNGVLGTIDKWLALPLFCVQFALIFALVATLFRDFRKFIFGLVSNKFTLAAVAVSAVMTVFAGTQIEAKHRASIDEELFLLIAKEMRSDLVSQPCYASEYRDGKIKCVDYSPIFKGRGLAFLEFLGSLILGENWAWAFWVQLLSLPIALMLFFLAILAWTREGVWALLSMTLLASQPELLLQFRSLSTEPLYVFMFSLSLLFLRFAFECNAWKHWALVALVLAFFAQTRQETVFCLAGFLFLAWPKLLDAKGPKAPIFLVLLSVFCTPILVMISLFQGYGFMGGVYDAHGHFFENLLINWNLVTDFEIRPDGFPKSPFMPYFNYLFACGGLLLVMRSTIEIVRKKPGYATSFLIFELLFHIQSYVILENISSDFNAEQNQRYMLVMLPALSLLGAYPLALLLKSVGRVVNSKVAVASALLLVCLPMAAVASIFGPAFKAGVAYGELYLTEEVSEVRKWLDGKNVGQSLIFYEYFQPLACHGYVVRGYNLSDAIRVFKQVEESQKAYYIRGANCLGNKPNLDKVAHPNSQEPCDVFERVFDLQKVVLIPINPQWREGYTLEISKVLGLKSRRGQKLLRKIDSSKDSLGNAVLEFRLNGASEESWLLVAKLDGEEFLNKPYVHGRELIKVENPSLSYAKVEVLVVDKSTDSALARHVEFVPPQPAKAVRADNGIIAIRGRPEIVARNVDSIFLDGEVYPHGFRIIDEGEINFGLRTKVRTFSAKIGLDEIDALYKAEIVLKIFGDGQLLYAGKLSSYEEILDISLDVGRYSVLTIKTEMPLEHTNRGIVTSIAVPVLVAK